MIMDLQWVLPVFVSLISITYGLPDEGKWDIAFNENSRPFYQEKSLYKGAQVYISINCETHSPNSKVLVNLAILQSPCWNPTDTYMELKQVMMSNKITLNSSKVYHSIDTYDCNDHIFLKEGKITDKSKHEAIHPVHQFTRDGVYVLGLSVTTNNSDYNVGVHLEIKSDYGYLSAVDWPLLPFYGFMCIYYIILGLIWLIMSFLQWRDLLRVQF